MASNLAIDTELLEKAKAIGHHKTKRGAVNAALKEYIKHKEQLQILDLFGKIDFDEDYDHKKGRSRNDDSH